MCVCVCVCVCVCIPRFEPWVRKIPWRREWLPTPVFLPGESHRQRSLVSYSPWDRKESHMTEWLTHTHTHIYNFIFFISYNYSLWNKNKPFKNELGQSDPFMGHLTKRIEIMIYLAQGTAVWKITRQIWAQEEQYENWRCQDAEPLYWQKVRCWGIIGREDTERTKDRESTQFIQEDERASGSKDALIVKKKKKFWPSCSLCRTWQ